MLMLDTLVSSKKGIVRIIIGKVTRAIERPNTRFDVWVQVDGGHSTAEKIPNVGWSTIKPVVGEIGVFLENSKQTSSERWHIFDYD